MNWTQTEARQFPRRYPSKGPLTPRERPDWMDDGACKRKTPLFFPGEHAGGQIEQAKSICRSCPVVGDCLAYALRYEEVDGVWGATSAEQRRGMIKARRKAGRRSPASPMPVSGSPLAKGDVG